MTAPLLVVIPNYESREICIKTQRMHTSLSTLFVERGKAVQMDAVDFIRLLHMYTGPWGISQWQ